MNAKMIEALKGVRDNLNIIIEESEKGLQVPAKEVVETKEVEEKAVDKAVEKKDNVVPITTKKKEVEEETASESVGEVTPEMLEALTYNELKSFAKDVGVKATGSRVELTKKILEADASGEIDPEDVEEAVEAVEEEEPKKVESKKKAPVKLGRKEEEVEEEPEEVDPLEAKVSEAVEDMTDEDILEVLLSAGVKAKGKRQALVSAVVKAVRDGKVELDLGDDEEVEEEPEVVEEEMTEDGELDYNDFDNEDMTKERLKALKDFEAVTREDFEEGAITRDALVDWLNDYRDTKGTMKDKSDDEILEEYIYYSWLLIDDEGEMPEEEGAYTVNGVPFCCGRPLEYLEENNTFICEYCGTEYEAE